MSADRWGVCPNCKKLQQEKRAKLLAAIEKARANKDFDSFALFTEQVNEPEIEPENTLREDWEVYLDTDTEDASDTEFCVTYQASCHVCKWLFKFSHSDTAILG